MKLKVFSIRRQGSFVRAVSSQRGCPVTLGHQEVEQVPRQGRHRQQAREGGEDPQEPETPEHHRYSRLRSFNLRTRGLDLSVYCIVVSALKINEFDWLKKVMRHFQHIVTMLLQKKLTAGPGYLIQI